MSFLIFSVSPFEVCAGGAHWSRLSYFIFVDIIAFEFPTAFLIFACPFSTIPGFSYRALSLLLLIWHVRETGTLGGGLNLWHYGYLCCNCGCWIWLIDHGGGDIMVDISFDVD